ncbi:hypothetical protein ACFLTP_08020 [Chloroflexota bacterium]
MVIRLTSKKVQVVDSIESINNTFIERGWSDGLPVIPPTEEAVEKMLSNMARDPSDVVMTVPPQWSKATVEKIAINAVMAGCLPEYLPIIVTALEAMSAEQFNLRGMQATTYPVAYLLIVNGPIAKKLDINGNSGVFGPGWRSNVTIARAIRLILNNIGGAVPGKTDMATQGKHIFCIAENEDENPWEPLHVERGFEASANIVTVAAAENPHNINDHHAINANQVLTNVCSVMATMTNNNILTQLGEVIVALGPEHAATIARDGLTKNDIRNFIHANAVVPRKNFHHRIIERYYRDFNEDALIPITPNKEDVAIIVAGGPGKHSSFLPSFGQTKSVTKPIS